MQNNQPSKPISETPSSRVGDLFTFMVPKVYYLRVVLAYIRRIYCLLTCQDDVTSRTATVGAEMVILRAPDALAKSTEITNTGTLPVEVYEDQRLIAIVPGGEGVTLPMSGNLILEGKIHGDSWFRIGETLFVPEARLDEGKSWPPLPAEVRLSSGKIITITAVESMDPESRLYSITASGLDSGDDERVIEAQGTASVLVVTHRRCLCGDVAYEDAPQPIGEEMI